MITQRKNLLEAKLMKSQILHFASPGTLIFTYKKYEKKA